MRSQDGPHSGGCRGRETLGPGVRAWVGAEGLRKLRKFKIWGDRLLNSRTNAREPGFRTRLPRAERPACEFFELANKVIGPQRTAGSGRHPDVVSVGCCEAFFQELLPAISVEARPPHFHIQQTRIVDSGDVRSIRLFGDRLLNSRMHGPCLLNQELSSLSPK